MRRRGVVLALVGILAVVLVDLAASRSATFVDLTADRTLSLTDETERIVDEVRTDVDITAFIRRNEPGRAEAASLLARYRRLNHRISYDVVDPASAPGEVRRLEVDTVTASVAVEMGDKVEIAAFASEQDVTAALARLLRGTQPTVCLTAGHGELDPAATVDEGLSAFADLLTDNGFHMRRVSLLARRGVPSECDVLVMVQATSPLGGAARAVDRYLRSGGRALVLADPSSTTDLSGILGPWGLGIKRGIVFEGDPAARFPDDPTSPIVSRYSTANPVVRKVPPTYFPGVEQVTVDDDSDLSGLTLSRLADTTPLSYLETKPLGARFDPDEDERGPITVLAAADRSGVEDGDIVRTRLVVSGDADIATNLFLHEAGNSRLLIQALDWLTLEENLVSVSAHLPGDRPLRLTDARLSYARFVMVGVVPGLLLIAGGVVWALRRSR